MVKTECTVCGREYVYDSCRGHTRARCNSCVANACRYDFKARIVEFLGGACSKCGYDKCLAALVPHHIDPTTKRFSFGNARCRAWARVVEELKKCVLLCANCHAEEHALHQQRVGVHIRKPERITIEWPSRSKLTRMVRDTPLSLIARSLGVSGVAVKKRCKKLGIETRGRGAWAKERATVLRSV